LPKNLKLLKALITITAFTVITPCKNIDHSKELVILIHGIMYSPLIMWKIEKSLTNAGYNTLNFDYASTRWPMDTVTEKLHQEITDKYSKYEKIHFVTHSLGGLVIRAYLDQFGSELEGHLVMIAPPNQGSITAERFEDFALFKWLLGEPGQHLGKDRDDYFKMYPPPRIHFGIIAGGLCNDKGFNPLIPGDDDGTVGVEETRIYGYADFIIIPGLHTTLLWQGEVIRQIITFIEEGKFDHQ